ncbi:MAG: DUF4349 domain-containing protein, partial [Dehalococcoidia bacterium]|nr:DUF4349 domain-containing protein [Dehalococcoidia bacterium]
AELLKKAATIDDILKVQQKLGDTRGQIERIKGRMIYLERRSDMATITVSLRPDSPARNVNSQTWDPIRVASDSWEASMIFLQTIGSLVIAIAVFFWWLIPMAILAVIAWRIWRSRRRPTTKPAA